MKQLIVNADDFGLAPSVNKAIIDCYRRRNVTSATMMVNMPGAEDAARLAKENPGLGVGLHFSLTEGRPLSRCPSLVDERGRFFERGKLLRRIAFGAVAAADIEAEFAAQLEKAKALGVKLTHVDSHQHLHMSPWIFRLVYPLLEKEGVPIRVVNPPLDLSLLFQRPVKFAKQAILWQRSQAYLAQEGIRANDCLVSVHDLDPARAFSAADYRGLIKASGERAVVELMVHPYLLGDDVLSLYKDTLPERMAFLKQCEREYHLLSEKGLFLDQREHQLVNYGQI